MGREEKRVPATFQVFINHRGPDVKHSVASLIYKDLTNYGLRVFLDKDEILIGDTICNAIYGAMDSASVHILIFSERYAQSAWCLDELCYILELSQNPASSHKPIIIAVFCDVEPTALRFLDKGCYAEAFKTHQDRFEKIKVEKWKAGLETAAGFSGYTFKQNASDHSKLLNDIVERVLKVVDREPLEVATFPVGLDQALGDLERQIDLKRGASKVVGIVGTGGTGKSSLAKHLFNLKRSEFQRSCYLSNIRENDLTALQRQLLRDLQGKNIDKFPSIDAGRNILRASSVVGFKILMVLDGVDDTAQIENLLDISAVGTGSLILITCRDKNILNRFSANILLYAVNPLQGKHAEELFCLHAFRQSEPRKGYEVLVKEFLEICEGLPLSLKLLGEELHRKLNITYWKSKLEMFHQGLPLPEADNIIKTLQVTYQAMDREEQSFFLDIGCFFVGEDTELAVRVLEGLGYWKSARDCLESLRQKHLLDFDFNMEYGREIESREQDEHPISKQVPSKDGDRPVYIDYFLPPVLRQESPKIVMRNQVREFARNIARQHLYSKDEQLRLSRSIDIQKMLQYKAGSDFCFVRGIRIPKDENPSPLTIEIKGVRLLVVEHPIEKKFFGSDIKGDLVWLRLRNFESNSFPSTISRRNLRVLEFQGAKDHVEALFNIYENETPMQLRELIIDPEGEATASIEDQQQMESSDSIPVFLQWIGRLSFLNKLVLKNIPFLQSLPFDFSNLECLQHLDLSGLINLRDLPISLPKLLRLQYLALRDCKKLSIPVGILGEISTLKYIDFKGCVELKQLPGGIANQRDLRCLNLLGTSLEELPLNLESLLKVEQLRIGSPELKKLPGSLASLKGLKELILSGCSKLDDITPISNLEHLERLEIFESTKDLQPGIIDLKNIKVLTIGDCQTLTEFSFQTHTPALREFKLTNTSISNIYIPTEVCPGLEIVDLTKSFRLLQVQGFPSTLVRLTLECCKRLKTLTNLSNLAHLKFLNITGCEELETLNVKGLRSLEEIEAEQCWKLQRIEAFEDLERLNFLGVSTSLDGGFFLDDLEVTDTLTVPVPATTTKKSPAELNIVPPQGIHIITLKSNIVQEVTDTLTVPVPATTTKKSPAKLKIVPPHSAIFMCFITKQNHGFCVNFEPGNKSTSTYKREERTLHMYLWTKDSKDANVAAYFIGNENELDAEDNDMDRGWIMQLASKTQFSNVCKHIGILNRGPIFEKISGMCMLFHTDCSRQIVHRHTDCARQIVHRISVRSRQIVHLISVRCPPRQIVHRHTDCARQIVDRISVRSRQIVHGISVRCPPNRIAPIG